MGGRLARGGGINQGVRAEPGCKCNAPSRLTHPFHLILPLTGLCNPRRHPVIYVCAQALAGRSVWWRGAGGPHRGAALEWAADWELHWHLHVCAPAAEQSIQLGVISIQLGVDAATQRLHGCRGCRVSAFEASGGIMHIQRCSPHLNMPTPPTLAVGALVPHMHVSLSSMLAIPHLCSRHAVLYLPDMQAGASI